MELELCQKQSMKYFLILLCLLEERKSSFDSRKNKIGLCQSIPDSDFSELFVQIPMTNTNSGGQTPVRQAGRFKNIFILLMKKLKCEMTETKFSKSFRFACRKVAGE